MQLTIEQRNFVVAYYLSTRIFEDFLEQRFRERVSSTKITNWKNITKYKTLKSSLNLNRDCSGCRRTKRIQENIILLQEKLIEDPKISLRKNCLDISKRTFNQITKRKLKWHPYKIHVRKERNIHI